MNITSAKIKNFRLLSDVELILEKKQLLLSEEIIVEKHL